MSYLLQYSQWKKIFEQASSGDLSTEVKFTFNFDSGKYLQSEIPVESLTKLKTDLTKPINLVRVPKYLNQKTVLTLIASTSKLGLGKELKNKLQSEGYKITGNGNDALCEARLKTLETITVSYFCEKLGCTPDELMSKITIEKVARPNSGGEATASDEERKKYQYMSMSLTQTGENIPEDRRIGCDMPARERKGTKADQSNNYVGYNADQFVQVAVGTVVTLKLDPMAIPDMVYFKYKDTEFLSPWLGAKTSQSGPPRNFETDLNDPAKCPGLVDAINNEIASVGGKLTVQSALAKNGGFVGNRFVVLPGPSQNGKKTETFSFPITKGFDLDNLTIRVFSPLAGTLFTISSACSKPSQQTQTKKP